MTDLVPTLPQFSGTVTGTATGTDTGTDGLGPETVPSLQVTEESQ